MFPDQRFGRSNLAVAQAVILRQFDLRLKPELGFAVCAVHVYVKAGLLAGEEEKAEAVLTEDGGTHGLFVLRVTRL